MKLIAFGLFAALLAMPAQSNAAEVKAFVTGAARAGFEILAPAFERATGHKVTAVFDLPPALVRKADAGDPFDVLILSYDVQSLIKDGKLASDSRAVLGRVGVGVAIPKGSPKPDFSSVEAFKRALLGAKLIATSGEGSSGRYVASLVQRLGVADQVLPKIRSGPGGASAAMLSKGEVDFAVTGLPPLIGVPNIEWLGYLPEEIQSWLVFSGGVNVKAQQPEAGRALLKALTSPEAMSVWKAHGLEAP